tara:strand:+ start:498 stop:1094 length:597 start_codon:yes stop_codon:yes gene_type:complete
MEEKIRLDIVGLSYSQTQTGAYALVLGEKEGKRRLPIIIGNFEAQAIAIELEKMKPSRPLTHDIFKSFADTFEINVTEVIIYNLIEGIFFAKIICEHMGKTEEIDARSSDAIALAVRFNCPVYTYEFILAQAGIVMEEEHDEEEPETEEIEIDVPGTQEKSGLSSYSVNELEEQLDQAINDENYELASKIRDEINRRS